MHMYQTEDAPFFDYNIGSIAGLDVRGKIPDFSSDFFVCVGAAQTFGRYVDKPYIDLLSTRLGLPGLNLSTGGAGPTLFQTEARLAILNRAKFVVVQVMAARAESNTIFRSDGKATLTVMIDGLRFANSDDQNQIHSMPINRHIAPLADLMAPRGVQMHSTMAYQILAECKDDLTCEMAIQESKLRYVASMSSLLRKICVPKYLLYFSVREPKVARNIAPPGRRKYRHAFDIEGEYPQFVDDEAMDLITPHADGIAYCVSTRGQPHQLPKGMTQLMPNGSLAPMGVNGYYPSPEMHDEAANSILEVLKSRNSK